MHADRVSARYRPTPSRSTGCGLRLGLHQDTPPLAFAVRPLSWRFLNGHVGPSQVSASAASARRIPSSVFAESCLLSVRTVPLLWVRLGAVRLPPLSTSLLLPLRPLTPSARRNHAESRASLPRFRRCDSLALCLRSHLSTDPEGTADLSLGLTS